MDVDTDISAHFESLKRQKQMLKMAQSRQGQSISNLMPREQMYQQFMMSHMAMEAEKNRKDDHMSHSSFIPPAYLPCTTPLAQLKPVTIRQLRAETHHRGTFLLLRAITPPNRMTAILVLAEDERGDAILLQMYQQEEEETREATELANVGTVLLIKEPYYKFMASGDYGLRVDHLSHVIQVHKDDPMIPHKWLPRISEVDTSSETYKSKGDTAIGAGKYWQAIKEYSDALRQTTTPDRVEIIKRNRSLAYLRTKQYDAALLDTGFPDFGQKPPEKALFRAAQALYSLRRFGESIAVLETLHTNFPDNREALAALERARNRHVEQTTGVYDFNLLQREAKKLKPPQLDHATYAAPVEIKSSAGKGRGLFVTRAVKAGELLLCEKAFSCAHVSETDKRMTFLMNVDTEKGFLGGQADLIRITAQRLYRNPSLAPEFTSLYHGTYKSANISTVDGTPVVDTFLIERIMSLNVFGCPTTSLSSHAAVIANKPSEDNEDKAYHSCGIWPLASHINHSCTSTARRSFIGDMMLVRATRDMERGTEIVFWYQVPDGYAVQKMQDTLRLTWGFACTCAMCTDAQQTHASVLAQRRTLMEKLKSLCKAAAASQKTPTSKVENVLKALGNTYSRPADQVPRLLLWDPQLLLTRVYMARGDAKKALESVQQVFVHLGFVVAGTESVAADFEIVKWGLVVGHLVEAFLHARDAYRGMGAWGNAKRAEGYARIAYKVVVGEDSSFESTYAQRV